MWASLFSPKNIFKIFCKCNQIWQNVIRFLGFYENSIWQDSNSHQSFCLTLAKYQSSILGYMQPWNTTLSKIDFGDQSLGLKNLLPVLGTFQRISDLSFWWLRPSVQFLSFLPQVHLFTYIFTEIELNRVRWLFLQTLIKLGS